MIDFGADVSCIQEGMIPSKYYEKSTEKLFLANGTEMKIRYELNIAYVCHQNGFQKLKLLFDMNMNLLLLL